MSIRSMMEKLNSEPSAPMNFRSTHAVNNPAPIPAMKNGISGSASRFQGNFPRCHQKTTSKAAGRLAMTVFDINPSRNSPNAIA